MEFVLFILGALGLVVLFFVLQGIEAIFAFRTLGGQARKTSELRAILERQIESAESNWSGAVLLGPRARRRLAALAIRWWFSYQWRQKRNSSHQGNRVEDLAKGLRDQIGRLGQEPRVESPDELATILADQLREFERDHPKLRPV